MLDLFLWIAITDIIGLIAFPFVFSLLPWLPDRGFTVSKVLGLLIVFYPVWILGSTFIVPNTSVTILVVVVAISFLSLVIAWLYQNSILRFIQDEWKMLLIAEITFLTVFSLWALIRSYDPAINHTEQPMDFAFLTTSIVSSSFPPQDPWFAGEPVSYYYFGYLIMGGIAQITGIAPSVAYNLALAFVPALTAIGIFGISSNLVRISGGNLKAAVLTGIISVFLLMGISNLESVLEFLRSSGFSSSHFWEWLNIKGLDGPLTSDKWYPTEPGWWWWRATRVIDTVENGVSFDYTITEFPFFSFLLGDLHPHVMSIPILLLFSTCMLNLFLVPEYLSIGWLKRNQSNLLLLSIILGGAGFINLWDFPTLATFLFITAFAVGYRQKATFRNALSSGSMLVSLVVPLSIILYLPFFGSFSSSAAGILPVQSIVTRHIHAGIIWGGFLLILVPFIIIAMWHILRHNRHIHREAVFAAAIAILPLMLWVLFPIIVQSLIAVGIPLGSGEIEKTISTLVFWDLTRLPQMLAERFLHLLPFLILLVTVVYLSLRYLRFRDWTPGFPLVLLILVLLLVVGPELFYVVDLFNNRMNTIFKFYYQAWIFIAVVSSYSLYFLTDRIIRGRYAFRVAGYCWVATVAVIFAMVLYYPASATYSKIGTLNKRATLDGLAHLHQEARDELMAINWLNVNSNHTDRIVEAVGTDYLADTSIVSASTGIPTLLGWPGHERQWRGINEIIDKREDDIELVYQSSTSQVVNKILRHYGVTYVVVGRKERAKYGESPLERFDSILEPVFTSNEHDKITIYRFKG